MSSGMKSSRALVILRLPINYTEDDSPNAVYKANSLLARPGVQRNF